MERKIIPPVEILPVEEQVAEIISDNEIPAIVVPQIIEENGKRYEVRQDPGCISRICLDEPEAPIEPAAPTLQEQVDDLKQEMELIKELL